MKAWEEFVSLLEKELGPEPTAQWIRPIRILKFDAANLYLEAPDPLSANWFEEHVRPRLGKNFVNENFRPIRVHLSAQKKEPLKPFPQPSQPLIQPEMLDPSCTIEQFVRDPKNEIVCRLISELNGGPISFNPIYLFGPPGCGKTHLLMAAAHRLLAIGKKAFYITADRFTEHVVQSIRTGRMNEFRRTYREIDVLLVDDIEALAGRSATQEEFFHTFNALHTAEKQVVIAGKLPPSKLEQIEERLISRFEWGISLELNKAPLEQIIVQKAAAWNISLTDPLLRFLIAKFPREPITALQAIAIRTQEKNPLTVPAAELLLSDLLRKEEAKAITPEAILKAVGAHFGVTVDDLLGKRQMREFALPRQVAMFLCRQKLKMAFQAIGKLFHRDHSTVMSSVKLIEEGIEKRNGEILEAVEAASRVTILRS